MVAISSNDGLQPGLQDPVLDSQRLFRSVLAAMAHPGTIVDLAVNLPVPAPLGVATAAVLLALADYETPLWLDAAAATPAACGYLRFHCGCPLTGQSDDAAFAVVCTPLAMPPLTAFQAGSDEYPDRSTTVIVQVPTLTGGPQWTLRGPGIQDSRSFAPAGLPEQFCRWAADNHGLFPRGVDLLFTSASSLAALPRSSRLEI